MHKQSFEREELLQCGKGNLFGPDSLRQPLPDMLMLDRITHISKEGGKYGEGTVTAELDIHPELWFFSCHFETDPVMPGSLGMDGLSQLVGFYLGWRGYTGRGRALGVKKIKFKGEVLPTSKKITYVLDVKQLRKGKMIIALADGAIYTKNAVICTAEDLSVAVFKK